MTTSSSFEHAPISKIFMITSSLLSFLLLNHHHLFNLSINSIQSSNQFQFWRIISHHLICSNLMDLSLILILFWNVSIPIERIFGPIKYASFLIIVITLGSFFEVIVLVIGKHLFDYQSIPPGPFLITFSILYQYQSLIPSLHDYHLIFKFDSHTFLPNLLSFFIFGLNPISSILGFLISSIYNQTQFNLNSWRISSNCLPNLFIQSLQTQPYVRFETSDSRHSRTLPLRIPEAPTDEILNQLSIMFPNLSHEEILIKWNSSNGNLSTTIDSILNSNPIR
ncbi:hypothetical protein DFH28DRAFT_955909 [Melampsora americana]|nr:hypothetical protein DFH28DRAFT_955909 [Melampsora americana]